MIIGFDIETTHLKANMGHILCAVAQPLGGKPKTWRIDKQSTWDTSKPSSFVDDKEMIAEIVEYLDKNATVLVTHYGSRFDIPFVNTRCLYWGITPPAPVAHVDLWRVSRKELALTSNRQATINDIVSAEHSKYKPGWEVWRAAQYGDKNALTALAKYCRNDVEGLLENYVAMRPVIRHHPYAHRFGAPRETCPACASDKTQHRGHRRTKALRIERLQCTKCGTWFDGKREKATVVG